MLPEDHCQGDAGTGHPIPNRSWVMRSDGTLKGPGLLFAQQLQAKTRLAHAITYTIRKTSSPVTHLYTSGRPSVFDASGCLQLPREKSGALEMESTLINLKMSVCMCPPAPRGRGPCRGHSTGRLGIGALVSRTPRLGSRCLPSQAQPPSRGHRTPERQAGQSNAKPAVSASFRWEVVTGCICLRTENRPQEEKHLLGMRRGCRTLLSRTL